MIDLVHYFAVAAITFAVFCRARKMSKCTPGWIKVQHGVTMILALLSLPVYRLDSTQALLSLALVIYVAFDAMRWPKLGHCE